MKRWIALAACAGLFSTACSRGSAQQPAAAPAAAAKPRLGIRPAGDETIKPDLSRVSDELKKVYGYIDEHIDEHVENLQKWVRQPSISNSGEGIPESAEMVKGFFEQLGCQTVLASAAPTSGAPEQAVVCERRRRTADARDLLELSTPRSPPADAWSAPPFEARLVEQPPQKVMIGRGTSNSKGPARLLGTP
jgi:hypothetical protein